MPELDGLKEELVYLRLWLGILGIIILAVALLFVGIALHAGREK